MLLLAHPHDAAGAIYLNMRGCSSRNGYSMFCAELMSNMKDVPSTERMVMCSQRWKLLKQNEKDGYQKRCEQVSSERVGQISEDKQAFVQVSERFLSVCFQRKKEYEIEMNRFLSVSVVVFIGPAVTGLVGVHRPSNRPHVLVFPSSRLCLRRSSSGSCQRRR